MDRWPSALQKLRDGGWVWVGWGLIAVGVAMPAIWWWQIIEAAVVVGMLAIAYLTGWESGADHALHLVVEEIERDLTREGWN